MTDGTTQGRILVADDDEQVRAVIARVLRSAGFEVDAVTDGAEATKRLAQKSYDLVITDLMMPGVSGIGLLRLVRARDLDLPVVIVAGAPSVQTAVDAVEHGAMRYLTKPFNPEEVVAVAEKGVALYRLAQVKRQLLQLTDADRLAGDRAGLAISFENALDQLWMAYQPIVSWTNRTLFAYEALMRSNEPTLPHPGAILQAAERLERLHELGRTVRGSVAQTMAKIPNIQVFVNLHTYDLMDPEIFQESSPLSQFSSRVVLEITERAALDRVEDVRSRVARLRELGYRIAVDDLGAGMPVSLVLLNLIQISSVTKMNKRENRQPVEVDLALGRTFCRVNPPSPLLQNSPPAESSPNCSRCPT